MANDYGEGHFLLVITLNQSNRGNTPFCGGKFEKRLRFLPFCDILFVPNNSIKKPHGDSIGIAVSSLFPCGKELLGDN